MTQQATTARPSPDVMPRQMENAQERLARAQVKVNELEVKVQTLTQQQQRAATGAEREQIGRTWAQAVHDLAEASAERQMAELRMNQLMGSPDPAPVPNFALAAPPSPQIATTAPPDPFLGPKDIVTVYIGGVILLLPLVLALSRRLWVRGVRREALDLENSPRLQRIEQAVESIAVEVERIGEAQRFTTKLLTERQLDAAPRMPVQPRREPGTITPH